MTDNQEETPMTPEEMEMLKSMGYGYPQEEEKQNIFTFFKKVIAQKDNSKTANLDIDELGIVRIPVRTCQDLALFCHSVGSTGLSKYFMNKGQILLGTSLSKDGFLDKLAVTQKREVESKRRRLFQNKGWFKKNKPVTEEIV